MSFVVEKPGMLTLVQDLGRWGHQFRGMTVSGPMDQFSLRLGNAMLGNEENDAALEILMPGLEIVFESECCVVLAGGGMTAAIDGAELPVWTARRVPPGGRLTVTGVFGGRGGGCRAYLCVSGGIGVPLVMGSRSTYTRAHIGGFGGRALKAGDVVELLEPRPLWRKSDGFVCPPGLRPERRDGEPLYAMDGPQTGAFTQKGVDTFYGSAYTVTAEADRMGCRLDGPVIEHKTGPDIVSDGAVKGSVQVPGDGKPIVLMSDCQTTGGYAKIAVVSTWSAAALARKMPGDTVTFRRASEEEAVKYLLDFERDMSMLAQMRASYRSR